MKRVVRPGVFESNSSMSHSLIIMTKDQDNQWEKKGYYYKKSRWWDPFEKEKIPEDKRPVDGEMYTEEEVMAFLELLENCNYNAEEWEDEGGSAQFIYECDAGFVNRDRWFDDEYLEFDNYKYTTPGGEEIIVYAKYGWDG